MTYWSHGVEAQPSEQGKVSLVGGPSSSLPCVALAMHSPELDQFMHFLGMLE